jgi:PPM family protein phosphatase
MRERAVNGAPVLDARRVTGTVYGLTDAGRVRRANQDSLLAADLSAARGVALLLDAEASSDAASPRRCEIGRKGLLLMVADGMGGAAAGGYASRLAVDVVYGWLRRHWIEDAGHAPLLFAQRLREALEEANRQVRDAAAARPELKGMGTTATVAGVLDGLLFLAQVGDSRAYLVRAGTAMQVTRDQSYVQMLVDAGRLSAAEAARSEFASVILQALGPQPTVEVDLGFQQLERDDVLLLCSDGLTRLVDAAEIGSVVAGAGGVREACVELLRLASERGAPDNVTIVVVQFGGEGLPAAGSFGPVVLRQLSGLDA